MYQYFPTDVRVRVAIEGDTRPLVPAARGVLFQAMNMDAAGSVQPIVVTRRMSDQVEISAMIFQGQKIVSIHRPRTVELPTRKEIQEELKIPVSGGSYVTLYNGWIKTGSVVVEDGVPKLDSFKPTPSNAAAYDLPFAFFKAKKLGGSSQANYIRGSMFSGAMKRVVQAILGLGEINDTSSLYITGQPPSPAKRTVQVTYSPEWSVTHGVIKTGAKNHWLVEVSSSNGVLAMPLPLIGSTKGSGYRRRIARLGDTDTVKILDEFGGLPSGESFPSGVDLENAITKGKVLRLMEPGDLSGFYGGGRQPVAPGQGWAFSESGNHLYNTCVGYDPNGEMGKYGRKSYMFGETWRLHVQLSAHDVSQLANDHPVGSGTAFLERLHRGKLDPVEMTGLYTGQPSSLRVNRFYAAVMNEAYCERMKGFNFHGSSISPRLASNPGWGADLWVFFDGDRLEKLSWVPYEDIAINSATESVDVATEDIIRWDAISSPDVVAQECYRKEMNLYSPWWYRIAYGWHTFSSPAFVGTSIELRSGVDGVGGDRRTIDVSRFDARPTPIYPSWDLGTGPGTCNVWRSRYIRPNDTGSAGSAADANSAHSYFSAIIPYGVREAYFITSARVLVTAHWPYDPPPRGDTVVFVKNSRAYIAGRGVVAMTQRQSNTYLSPIPPGSTSMPSGEDPVYFGVSASAGARPEFAATDSFWMGSENHRPSIRAVGAAELANHDIHKINWVGSV